MDSQSAALEFHALGLNLIPLHQATKRPALHTFDWWQYDQQEANDLMRVLYKADLDIGILGGAASSNAFFVDCETAECFAELRNVITQHCGETPTVISARGGHLYLRSPFPVRSRSYGDFEIKGQGNYVAAPPSIHPSGQPYRFAGNARLLPLVASLPFTTLEPKFVPKVSRFAHDLFRGREQHTYNSRSERDYAFILSLVRSGFHRDTIQKALSIAHFPSKYRELAQDNPKSAQQYLEHSIKQALAQEESQDILAVRAVLNQWEAWATQERWTGRTGAVDRAIFLAHLFCAHTANKLLYHASVRQLAELAQTSPITASRANHRLRDLGIIRLARPYVGLDAAIYALPEDAPNTQSTFTVHSVDSDCPPFMSECHLKVDDPFASVWEHRGLGKTAHLIWRILKQPQPDYKTIAAASGRGFGTVQRWLPRLLNLGLALKTPTGYQQGDHVDWEQVATLLGTRHKQAERLVKHQKQRQQYQNGKARTHRPTKETDR